MSAETPAVCPLCQLVKTSCRCTSRLSPFQLYDRYGNSAGSPVTIELALALKSLFDKSSSGPFKIFDRHGLPVKLPTS